MKDWIMEHRRLAQILWTALGIVLTLGAEFYQLFRNGEASFVALVAFLSLWMLGGWYFLNRWSIKEAQVANAALNLQCDPEPLLRWSQKEIGYWGKRRVNYRYLAACHLNQSVALSALGRWEEAMAAVETVDREKLSRMPVPNQLVYWLNLCSALLGQDRRAEAERALQEADRLLSSAGKLAQNQRFALEHALEGGRCGLLLAQGQLDGLEERLQAMLERAGCEYLRVSNHAQLAILYAKQGRDEDAVEELRYVAEHGNKLAVRAWAEEKLSARKA